MATPKSSGTIHPREDRWVYSRDDIGYLSDRLFSVGISSLTTLTVRERRDCIAASRLLTRLLQKYERDTGRTIQNLTLGGYTGRD